MKNEHGFTAVEFIISIGIGALILSLSFPALKVTRNLLKSQTTVATELDPIRNVRNAIHSAAISSASLTGLKTISILTSGELLKRFPKLHPSIGSSAILFLIPEPGTLLRRAGFGKYRSIGWNDPVTTTEWLAISYDQSLECAGSLTPAGLNTVTFLPVNRCGGTLNSSIGYIGLSDTILFYTDRSGSIRRYSPFTGENQPLARVPIQISVNEEIRTENSVGYIVHLTGPTTTLDLPLPIALDQPRRFMAFS